RDVEFLRDRLGAPIAFDPERNGHDYTDPDSRPPAVAMTKGRPHGGPTLGPWSTAVRSEPRSSTRSIGTDDGRRTRRSSRRRISESTTPLAGSRRLLQGDDETSRRVRLHFHGPTARGAV